MADETVYSSAPLLGSPRRFVAEGRADLRVVPAAAWRMWLRGTQARYRQSALGYVWLMVPPLAIALTWAYLSHVRVVRFGDTGIPYLAYVLTGTLLWQVFTDALLAPLRRLSEARSLLTKVLLPHETWLLAGVFDVVFNFVVRLVVLVIVLIAVGTPLRAAVLLAPLGVLGIAVLGLAIGVVLAPVGLLYEDVGEALTVVTGLWFFLTPVIYPWPIHGATTWLVQANPVTPLLVTTRAWIAGAPGAQPGRGAVVLACSLFVLVVAALVARLARPHLVARL